MNTSPIQKFTNIFLVFFGNTIYALGVTMFILPNQMITGGTTGLGLAFQHYFQIPISLFVLCFNFIMFLIGAFVLGKHFAFTTLISTFYYPFILGIFQKIPSLGTLTGDKMLSTICGGAMIGFAIGVVIRAGASTGGMDIPPLVLNKKFGLPVSVLLYVFDVLILLFQMSFSNAEQIIYGIVIVLIYTVVLDKILLMGTTQTQVKIISREYEKINQMIQQKLDRGTTFIKAQTGYLKEDQPIILTVVSNRELARLNQMISQIDDKAFLIVEHVNEVKGRGFTDQKIYK